MGRRMRALQDTARILFGGKWSYVAFNVIWPFYLTNSINLSLNILFLVFRLVFRIWSISEFWQSDSTSPLNLIGVLGRMGKKAL